MKLLLVRHGQTDWNRDLRYQGQKDTDLNSTGKEQAMQTAFILEKFGPKELYSSDLKRAIQTASIIGKHLGLVPKVNSKLREIDFGDWTGRTYSEVKDLFPEEVSVWLQDPFKASISGGESLNNVLERVLNSIDEICAASSGNTIVIVTHGGPIRLLLEHIQVKGAMWEYPVKSGSVIIVERKSGELNLIGRG